MTRFHLCSLVGDGFAGNVGAVAGASVDLFADLEFAYDNYNFFVIGFGPNKRPSDCIVSSTAAASRVGLCFLHGVRLPDPDKVLLGAGKQTRFVRLPSADVLDQPAIQTLLCQAAERAQTPLPTTGRGKLVIRSVSTKQRPRR